VAGFCGSLGGLKVSAALIHHGEEPPISGCPPGGSGTIFFTRCNLECVFCQNHQISQGKAQGELMSSMSLVELMFKLKEIGAYNINLVSPTPYVLDIVKALSMAKNQGLDLPIVYNTGGYDSDESLDMLEGLVDVYLPDAKLGYQGGKYPTELDPRSLELLGVPDYPQRNMEAMVKMLKQVGHLELDGHGLATRGLLVRHLVLPDNIARTNAVLNFIAKELGPMCHLSLMSQYHPCNKVELGHNPGFSRYPGLGRPLSIREYDKWVELAWSLGLENTFVQELDSCDNYLPDFSTTHVFS
jgi:putative pyruvate formate lyase activating enzyme